MSVTTPDEDPCIVTPTPGSPVPDASLTVPLTVTLSCAKPSALKIASETEIVKILNKYLIRVISYGY